MLELGVVRPGSTVRIPFSTFDKDDGSSITMTNFAAADILVYKDGSTTERASTSGYTATTDFDSKTGKHLIIIDLTDNTTAGFWAAGSEYLVAIDAVTVDAVTTGGWVARFRIGQREAIFDTTIATLATQTSFTLSAGSADDDVYNGMLVLFHDVASAVQMATGIVADYTGSTKTITLVSAPAFTIAATDNISFMWPAPLQPTVIGRTLDVSSGGEAGIDWANVGSPTTTLNLSGTTVGTTTTNADMISAGGIRSAVGLASANLDTQLSAIAGYIDTEVATVISQTTAASIRSAVGLASANLDTQLTTIDDFLDTEIAAIKAKTDLIPSDPADASDIAALIDALPTAAEIWDLPDGVEAGLTPRGAFRLCTSALVGKLSGAAGTTVVFRNVGDTKNRISATVDADGNRSAVTTDAT